MVKSSLPLSKLKSRKERKDEATALVRSLTESAVALSGKNLPLAKEKATLARKLKLKYNIRLEPALRMFTCKGCKSLIVPGVNARIRLGHGKTKSLRITCSECGHVTRKILEIP